MQNDFKKAILELSDLAAAVTQKYFRSDLSIMMKENISPVTKADQETEMAIRQWLQAHYPTHGLIGEEYGNIDAQSPYTWVIDPIDGTVAYTTGKPTFATLIALLENDIPTLSVIDQAISKERWIGQQGTASTLNGQAVQTSKIAELSFARMNCTTPYMFISPEEKTAFERLRKAVRLTSFSGDAYAYGLLASGHIDVILEADLKYYDVAALIPIIEGAGGIITDWQGQKITPQFHGQCLATGNAELHAQALQVIKS